VNFSEFFRKTGIYISICFFLISAIFIFSIIFFENSRKFLTVIFLDVGQGDAIFIETPNGNKLLIDGGETSAVVRELSKFLPFYDRTINMIISSHSDLDHIGGFPEIFKRYNIEKYATSEKNDHADLYLELERLSESERADRLSLKSGDRIILDELAGIYLDVLWPIDANSIEDNNDTSVVLKLVFNKTSFLLTGDASKISESEIISYFKDKENTIANISLKSDVLKIGHHGSKTSTGVEFLDMVSPEYSIISVGKDNKFNHPDKETLDSLVNKKTKVLETSTLGSIVFKSDGENLRLIEN
jgi:competence protein ComEC